MYLNNMTHEQLTPPFANTGSDTQLIKENFFSRKARRDAEMREELERYLRGEIPIDEAKHIFNHKAHGEIWE